MKKFLLIIVLALSCMAARAGHIMYFKAGPWVTNVSETGFNVLWTTQNDCMSYVEIAPDDNTAFNACDRPRYYQTASGRSVCRTLHNVRIDGLQPGTTYRYRITVQELRDDSDPYAIEYKAVMHAATPRPAKKTVFTAKTLNAASPTCSLTMINDMHFNLGKYASLLAPVKADSVDFLLLNGDIVSYSQNVDSVAKYTFPNSVDLVTSVPIVYSRGNHESRGHDFDKVEQLTPTPISNSTGSRSWNG